MRDAILDAVAHSRMTPRSLINDALVRFERTVQAEIADGVRPAALFSERDRIVRELRSFIDGRVSARLAALRRRDLIALGREAAPFDAIVRGRRGACYGLLFRRFPVDGRRLDALRSVHAALRKARTPLRGVLVYDFGSGLARLVLNDPGADRVYRDLRAS
jgi:hypothetical protein